MADLAPVPGLLRGDDRAVSPIIGTLLVVAMTMVLTAAVWFVVAGIGNKTEDAPLVSFRLDQVNQRVTVVRVEAGVDWTLDLALHGTCGPQVTLNGAAFPPPPGPDREVRPGDVLAGCGDGQTLRIVATKPNQMIFETTF